LKRWLDTPRRRIGVLALACWVAVLLTMEAVQVPYVRLSPGPVFNVLGEADGEQIITIDGARDYGADGVLDMTTVSERGGPFGDLTLLEAFTGWIDPSVFVVPTELLYPPDTTGDQAQQRGDEEFSSSQEMARIAALREVGEPVRTRPWVVQVQPDAPAQGVLEHGDVVLAVDGRPVSGPKQMARRVRDAGVGEIVDVDVRRGDEQRTVAATTGPNPDDPSAGYLGVTLGILAESQVTVGFNLEDVGGPSAGLVFALGLVDRLTPGDLLDGLQVAGTGTIDDRGRVGAIGGVVQKMAAARDAGATMFLAPEANCPQIAGSVPDGLTVVPVATLGEARDVLEGRIDPPRCEI
jgi:PDZ domain-containing protein